MRNGIPPDQTLASADSGGATAARADLLTEASDDRIADVFSRLADTVAVLDGANTGAPIADPWAEEKVDLEEEDFEKEPAELEEQGGVDDPVRMYLREIGKVYLLSGADEKRLARSMEEAKHVDAIETGWEAAHGRLP